MFHLTPITICPWDEILQDCIVTPWLSSQRLPPLSCRPSGICKCGRRREGGREGGIHPKHANFLSCYQLINIQFCICSIQSAPALLLPAKIKQQQFQYLIRLDDECLIEFLIRICNGIKCDSSLMRGRVDARNSLKLHQR